MKKKGNIKNLVVPTSEEARRNGRLGGITRQRNLKIQKTFTEIIKTALSLSPSAKIQQQMTKAFALKGSAITNQEAMVFSQIAKAISKQDTQAFTAIVDRIEGKPTTSMELSGKDGGAIETNTTIDLNLDKNTLKALAFGAEEKEGK